MKATLLLSLSLLLWLHSGSAQSGDIWTLERCIDHAFEHNLTIANADISLTRSEIELTRSRHQRYPSLNGSSSLNLNFGRSLDPTTNDFSTQSFLSNNVGLNSSMILYNGGRINNSIQQAELLRDASLLDQDQTRRDVALQVAQTYLNTLFAIENLTISQQQLDLSQQQLDQIENLVRAGSRAANEVLDIQAQIATNEQSIVNSENQVTIAYLNLKQLLRLDPDVEMQVLRPENVDVTMDPEAVTFAEVYARALETQAFVRAGELRVSGARTATAIAKAGYLPSLGIGASLGSNYNNQALTFGDPTGLEVVTRPVQIDGADVSLGEFRPTFDPVNTSYVDQFDQNLAYGFGLQLSVPIYNNYNTKASVENAKLNTILEENQLIQLKENLKITIQQALADARAGKRAYLASQKTEEASRLSYENAQKRYDLGAINPIDYVTINNQYQNAQINSLIAKYDYLFRSKVLDFYLGNELNLR